MDTINISKQEYEELLKKVHELEEFKKSKREFKETDQEISDELREEMEMWQKASDEDLAEFNKKHNL